MLNSFELVGEPVSNAIFYARTGWFNRNPKLAAAIVAAIDEANAEIAKDPLQAAKDYVAATNEKTPPETLVQIMKEPGTNFSTTPFGIMLQARHFYAMKTIKAEPKDRKDTFFPHCPRAARPVRPPGGDPRRDPSEALQGRRRDGVAACCERTANRFKSSVLGGKSPGRQRRCMRRFPSSGWSRVPS